MFCEPSIKDGEGVESELIREEQTKGRITMNSCIKFIGTTGYGSRFNFRTLVAVGGVFIIGGTICSAAFRENFQDDTAGAPPTPGWTITSGTNGTTVTANVATEGTNQFLALRDFSSVNSATESRQDNVSGKYEKAGWLQFDIRINQGINGAAFMVLLKGSTFPYSGSNYQPIGLSFFHNAYSTNYPDLYLQASGSPGSTITNKFPIGSWQTIRIDFASMGGGTPRGIFTVNWNGMTTTNSYLDQGANGLAIDQLQFTTVGGNANSLNIDIDNIQFIPEPTAAALVAVVIGLGALNRRRA